MRISFFIILTLFTAPIFGQDTIVNTGEKWKYHHGTYLSSKWYFDPSISENWEAAISPFGTDLTGNFTDILDLDIEDNGNFISYYLTTFYLEDPSDVLAYEIRLRRDDGAVVYVNGYELYRSNVGHGDLSTIKYADSDTHGSEEDFYYKEVFSSENFNRGINTIAVAVYQREGNTTDAVFDLQLIEHNDLEIIPDLLKHMGEDNSQLTLKLRELALSEHINEAENERDVLIQAKRYDHLIRNVFIVLFSLSFIALLIVLKQLRTISKQKKHFEEMSENLRKEILNTSIYNLNSYQYLEEIKANINKVIKEQNYSNLKNISNNIDSKISKEEDWMNLEFQFNLLNSGFVDRLKKAYPSLSATELRHCIFIKSLIPAKQVATLMQIEIRTVQSTWYRIKKKLNLPPEEDLKNYLINF